MNLNPNSKVGYGEFRLQKSAMVNFLASKVGNGEFPPPPHPHPPATGLKEFEAWG